MFATVFRSPNLRRVEVAFLTFNIAEWATWIAILVFAYQFGGAPAAGLVAFVQLLPAAIVAPFAALLGDRYPRERMIVLGYVLQAVTMAVTGAALLTEAPVALIYVLAASAAASITLTRPLQSALLPSLSSTTDELTSANVAAGSIESFSMLAGPALTGVLLGVSSPGVVFVAMSGVVLIGALLVGKLDRQPTSPQPGGSPVSELRPDALGGFRAVASEPHSRLLVALIGAQFIVLGALDVLFVVLALGVLDIGQPGAGWLNAAFGAGGLLGTLVTVRLVGRRRLAPALASGITVFGFALVAIGIVPHRAVVPALLVTCGAGRTLMDVAGRTLLQRVVPSDVMARVFGVLEGLAMAGLAAGSVLVPLLIGLFGIRPAVVLVGCFLPVLGLCTWKALRPVDAVARVPAEGLELLQRVPIFSLLGGPVLERMGQELVAVQWPAESTIICRGEAGHRFYIVAEGEVEVSIEGRPLATGGRGYFFGEIALLRDVPRTATVEARTAVRAYALERHTFLEAVTGHPQTRVAADRVVGERLQNQPGD